MEAQTVEVLRLTEAGSARAGLYGIAEHCSSIAFPDLIVSVAELFAD